jgi:hypothetical protein
MRWGRRTREQDLERELDSHLELEAQEQQECGLSPDDARYAARRAFGNAASVQELTREAWGWTWLERLGQDLRYALRSLLRAPAAATVLTLFHRANTAMFMWWRPCCCGRCPTSDPGRLAAFGVFQQVTSGSVAHQEFLTWVAQNRT